MKVRYFALVLFLASAVIASATDSYVLKQIEDQYWQHVLEKNVHLRIKYGMPVEEFPDVSFKESESEARFSRTLLDQLLEIQSTSLSHAEKISYESLKWELEATIEGQKYYWLFFEVTPYSSGLSALPRVLALHPLGEEKDLHHFVQLLKKVPSYLMAMREKTEGQFARGILLPKEELQLVIPYMSGYIQAPEQSPFAVSVERLQSISSDAAESFQKEVAVTISNEINPELKKLVDFLSGDYIKKAPDAVGPGQYPEGKEFYKFLVRYHTTMEVTPEEIHQIGLQEVEKINAEMLKIRQTLGFQGTAVEFRQRLKTDPKVIPKTPEEIGEKLMACDRKITPKIDQYFVALPKAPHGVKRLDPKLEGAQTFGYYEEPSKAEPRGTYYYNASNLSERSLLSAAPLIYHELIPGHHFQICLQSENQELPQYRRESFHNAFVEGWGEYASELAGEMGMYEDPYDRYGRLSMNMLLSTRLVVDTGMNYLGWSRSKAVEFMRQNMMESDTQIHTESLRYCCDMPGQALGYRMGARKILELREKAKKALGEKFDIRKFHEAVLGLGSMPMAVLEKQIDWFIQNQREP